MPACSGWISKASEYASPGAPEVDPPGDTAVQTFLLSLTAIAKGPDLG
jgi:hypothetical protein